ncbi:MAG: carboxypeptidase-like regulatory domain-containing protein [Proteobacteria bacterium]|nr:carboxypeptidase regulatory-like domain-containing protein [Desulfobulbaceae bacterium]MBU4151632.1 carboxypeptidase-like regulatory domain-containing protein [Pseudomonadota bacterium]
MTMKRIFYFVSVFMLMCCSVQDAIAEGDAVPADLGKVKGKIVDVAGAPLSKGFVSFFDSNKGDPMDFGASKRSPAMIAFLQEGGVLETDWFPAGSYYLGVLPRERWVGGPPKENEKRYSAFDAEGKYLVVVVKAGETIDVGTISVKEPEKFPELTMFFTVAGRIIDEEGRGVQNAVVVVKQDLDNPKGLFISKETDLTGKYELKIPPGKYFFVARKELTVAGRPKPGGLMGTLGHNKPIGVGGESDEPASYIVGLAGHSYEHVDITMFKVPIPEVRRAEVEAKVKAKKIDKDSLPDTLPLKRKRSGNVEESEQSYKGGEQNVGPK